MSKYITHLLVSLDAAHKEKLQSKGFEKISVNLEQGPGGKSIHVWYKKEDGESPVTRVQFTFNREMEGGLVKAGYISTSDDLCAGEKYDSINTWCFQGRTEYDTPIVDVDFTVNDEGACEKFCSGWERLALNLNPTPGESWVNLWLKREKQTYICDVSATDSYASDYDYFQAGYIRMDEDTNLFSGGSDVYIWYRQTTDPQRSLSELNVSTNDLEYQVLQQQQYRQVSIDLNRETRGNQVYMWFKKQRGNHPIQTITLLLNLLAVEEFEKAAVTVIKKDLNAGNKGFTEYLCVKQ